ncbi:NHL repeat-containing protein, partial [Arthrobacter sp. HLT1-20]
MRSSKQSVGNSYLKKAGGAGLTAALITGGFIIIPQPAFAASVFPDTGMYATQSGGSNIVSVDLATGTTSLVLTVPGGVTGLNQIGLTNDGNKVLLTNGTSIFEYTASTENWETTARATPAVPNTMGGVNPANGIFYFGGQAAGGGNNFVFKTFDPATNTLATSTIPVTADAPPGGNGDLAFDSLGNMYFVASSAAAAQIYRVDASQLTSSGGAATKVGPQIANGVALNSMAFAKDGFLYVAGGGANGFLRVNPITGQVMERKTLDVAITDLGSRSLPFTGSVRVDLPQERVNDTDQFTVTIGGGGISTGNTGTTTGNNDSKSVGPLLILPGETYTVEQTPAGTTNPALYETSWKCVDPATGTVVASGPGASGSFTIPQGVQNVSCSFTTAPYAAPEAVKDESLNNVQGSAVKVPVLNNDKGDLDPTTVKLINAEN